MREGYLESVKGGGRYRQRKRSRELYRGIERDVEGGTERRGRVKQGEVDRDRQIQRNRGAER